MSNPKLMRKLRLCGFALLGLLAWGIACDGTVSFPLFDDEADRNENSDSEPAPESEGESLVVVRLVNVSALALDVRFFVSTDPTVTTAEELFVEGNAFREGIGFLSLGVLGPGEAVDVPIACEEVVFLGTQGGEFLDPETGESVAQSAKPRLAALGPQFDCGDRVTFRFFADENGQPTATLGIQ